MLHLEIIDEHGRPVLIRGSRIVIRDAATRTPLSLVVEYSPGSYAAAKAGDHDFQTLLRSLRINDTVLVDKLSKNQVLMPELNL